MTEWWFVAVPVALLCGVSSWIRLDEEGVPHALAVPISSALGLVCGAAVLAFGGVI